MPFFGFPTTDKCEKISSVKNATGILSISFARFLKNEINLTLLGDQHTNPI